MSNVVLDASALLSLLNNEPGAERVIQVLPNACLSSVNLAEVVGKLIDHRIPGEQIHRLVSELGLRIVEFSRRAAFLAGELRAETRKYGLSLGDRACLALGLESGLPVLSADRSWANLDIGVDIELIRFSQSTGS